MPRSNSSDPPEDAPPPAGPEGKGALARRLLTVMADLTLERVGGMAFENAMRNAALRDRGRSIAALRDAPPGTGDSAIVIAAGPSIKRRDPLRQIKEAGYKGAIIATDSALYYCLRNGVVPDLTVTVDPHATRVVRWFGEPGLDERGLATDDYFRRQDMDDSFAREIEINREIYALLDRYGPQIKIALATSASQPVVDRVLATGMQIFWWNPMLDDPDLPDSRTMAMFRANRFPCVNGGGNVGTACYMIAHAVLGKRHVALTGIDFSYYDDTPRQSTQYYYEALSLVGEEKLDSLFVEFDNPYTGTRFYTDPAYLWFREVFLELAAEADCTTYNCTEGGILFGDGITFIPLAEFLAQHG